MLFESLFYKVRVPADKLPHEWDSKNYLFENSQALQRDGFKLIEHPADTFIDYNSMVDNLEEEHIRRDVFTTALESPD